MTGTTPPFFDVIIVGAGISGIGSAYHLKDQCPGKSFLVIDSQTTFGGTWKTHTYPGIRSDSDLFTFGYRFKPWTGNPIATGAQILSYLKEVIQEHDLAPHIRYQSTIVSAKWSTPDQRWTLEVHDASTDQTNSMSCGFLWLCQGYYRHSEGYTPEWPGMASFREQIIHPQKWPEGLSTLGKRVVVIGSGATAATLIPALADKCAHVTMLQRSPTYFRTAANANELANTLRALDVPQEWTHEIVRRKILFDQAAYIKRSKQEPEVVKRELIDNVRTFLGEDFDVEKHFMPSYRPWQQRLAYVPDGDLFHAIAAKKASVVTDNIDCFTESGIKLKSGEVLPADIIVTATGFNMNVLGDISFTVDGKPLDFHQTVTYRGALFSGVPNFVWTLGYARASWTLRVDLLGDFVCRMLKQMDDQKMGVVTPVFQAEAGQATPPLKPWVDKDNFNAGYMLRTLHLMPKQTDHQPWKRETDYWTERELLPTADLNDGALQFSPKTKRD